MALNHPEVNMLYKNSSIFIVDFNINKIILIILKLILGYTSIFTAVIRTS